MKLEFNKSEADVSKFIIGKAYRLKFTINNREYEIKKGLIDEINIEENSVVFTPLVDDDTEQQLQPQFDMDNILSMEMKDRDGNLLLKVK